MLSLSSRAICFSAVTWACSASDTVKEPTEYLSLMQLRAQERRGGVATVPLGSTDTLGYSTPDALGDAALAALSPLSQFSPEMSAAAAQDSLANALAAYAPPVVAASTINVDPSIVGAASAAQVAGSLQQGDDIFGVAAAMPQPAGWGPEAELPEPVQPAGWGGYGGKKAYMITTQPTEVAALPTDIAAAQLTPTTILGLTQEVQLESLLPHVPTRHSANEPMSALSFDTSVGNEVSASGSQTPAGWGPGPRTARVTFAGVVPDLSSTVPQVITEAVTALPKDPSKPVEPVEPKQELKAVNVLQTGTVSAASVALNDDAYRSLIGNGTPEMALFIRRVGQSRDFAVTDEGSLMGFAKFYSGEVGSSSFEHLLTELEKVSKLPGGWLKIGRGASAKLNEAGFGDVVATGTNSEVLAFVRRVIRAHGLSVANEGSLAGLSSYYKSQKKVPMHRLVNELDEISRLPDGWLKRSSAPLTGLSASLDTAGALAVQDKKFKGTREMSLFVRRVVASKKMHVADEGGLQGFADFYSSSSAGGYPRMVKEMGDIAAKADGWVQAGDKAATGLKASLDEAGLEKIQSGYKKGSQSQATAVFIRRVAESRLYGVADEGGLQGFAKFYSGQAGKSNYKHLLAELDTIRVLPTGWLKGLGLD